MWQNRDLGLDPGLNSPEGADTAQPSSRPMALVIFVKAAYCFFKEGKRIL